MDNKTLTRLRDLAKQVRDIAGDPVQEENKKLWTAVNDNRMIQPVALVRDYNLDILAYEDELEAAIEDEELRYFENHLLALIYQWKHLKCHSVTEKFLLCDAVVEESVRFLDLPTGGMFGRPDFWRLGTATKRSKHFEVFIKDEKDIEKIRMPVIHYDEEATKKRASRLNEIFDGILPVYPKGFDNFAFAPWDQLIQVAGIDEVMYGLSLNPDFMKTLVNRIIDVYLAHAEKLEKLGLLNNTNRSAMIGQGGYGYSSELPALPKDGGVMGAKMKDMWGSSTDQIFTSVSPEMSYEFSVEPESRWAEKFGLFYYGCCERLDHKLDEVLKFPKVRRISCSPYSNREAFMEKLGNRAVVSFKPDSVLLSRTDWDIKVSRDELLDVCRLARKYHCSVEVLMKTLISLNGDPRRLWQWSDMARDVLANYS
jgi:hypothetical protein